MYIDKQAAKYDIPKVGFEEDPDYYGDAAESIIDKMDARNMSTFSTLEKQEIGDYIRSLPIDEATYLMNYFNKVEVLSESDFVLDSAEAIRILQSILSSYSAEDYGPYAEELRESDEEKVEKRGAGPDEEPQAEGVEEHISKNIDELINKVEADIEKFKNMTEAENKEQHMSAHKELYYYARFLLEHLKSIAGADMGEDDVLELSGDMMAVDIDDDKLFYGE